METHEQEMFTPQSVKQELNEMVDEIVITESLKLNGSSHHNLEQLKENNMNHQNIPSNESGDIEKLLTSISILKHLNDEIISLVIERLTLADDNVASLKKENDNLRQLLKEMTDHEAKTKEKLLNGIKAKESSFAKIIQQKEDEYEQLRQAYDEIAERGGNNQEVSKLQNKLKFTETKLKNVQIQLDIKTRENEELTTMVNDMCGESQPV